jgi:hypothetical protein
MSSRKKSSSANGLRNRPNGKRVKKVQGVPNGVRTGLTLYKSPRPIMPNEYDTTLKYIVVYTIGSAAAVLASHRFTSNAYDVDPALGSTAMAGFTAMSNIYQRFRTLGMRYKFNCANSEAFPVTVIHGFSNVSIASGSLGMNYGENPLFRTDILGPLTGMSRGVFTQTQSVVNISGTAQCLYDDIFTGSTTSSTLATGGTVWCYIGFGTPAASAFTALGVLVHAEVDLHVRFYRPNFLVG